MGKRCKTRITRNVRFWPKADPENSSFGGVKASALEKSRHSAFKLELPSNYRLGNVRFAPENGH